MNYIATTNPLKTKSWFYSKPELVKPMYFSLWFEGTIQFYGQVFLIVSILLSIAGLFYLNRVEGEYRFSFQTAIHETQQLTQKNKHLEMQLEQLVKIGYFGSLASKVGMVTLDDKDKIILTTNQ